MEKVECVFPNEEAYADEGLRGQEVIITPWAVFVNLSLDCFHFRTSSKQSLHLHLDSRNGKQNYQEQGSRVAIGLPFMQVPLCKSK